MDEKTLLVRMDRILGILEKVLHPLLVRGSFGRALELSPQVLRLVGHHIWTLLKN